VVDRIPASGRSLAQEIQALSEEDQRGINAPFGESPRAGIAVEIPL